MDDVAEDLRVRIGIGSTVTLAAPDGKGVRFTVVEGREADPARGLVSEEAPIAWAVMGRGVGEVVVPTPREERPYRIVMASGPPLRGGAAVEKRTEGAMISVEQEAKEFLGGMECPEGKVLRLEEYWSETGKRRVRFEIGDPEAGDEILCREGKTSLHVRRSVNEGFAGFVVTRVDGPEGVGIALSPPDAGEFSW